MLATRSGRTILFLAACALAALMLGPQLINPGGQPETRKITFKATVGDGKSWAGGFRLVYTVGNNAQTVDVLPLPRNNPSKNRAQVTKTVAVGTSVAVTAYADWPNVLVVVQLAGQGVNPRPQQATSPKQPLVVDTVK